MLCPCLVRKLIFTVYEETSEMLLLAVNLPMQPSLWVPSSLGRGKGSGKLGLPRAVSFSFGWCFTTGFGQLII